MRKIFVFGAGALALLVGVAAGAQTSPVVGTWGTTLNPGKANVIYVTMTMLPNLQFTEHWMDRLGLALNLLGTYQYNAAASTLTYTITDYSPRADCTPGSGVPCTSVMAPEAQGLIGKQQIDKVQFQNPNFMWAKGPEGEVAGWTRLN
jgi:hypothetical protein